MTSTTHPVGITLNLTETGIDSGVFDGSFTFTDGPSSADKLQANAGDKIIAIFAGVNNSVNIFPRVLLFNDPDDDGLATLNDSENITVHDQNSNENPTVKEKITVGIESSTDAVGISVELTETGNDSGIFEHTELVFSDQKPSHFSKMIQFS